MSYRTFKRVLGETSLERKCRWWFGISLAVLLTLSFTWYGRRTDEIVYDTAAGRTLVYAEDKVFAHDVANSQWDVLFDATVDETAPPSLGAGMAWDPVNERLVVLGGIVDATREPWFTTLGVSAFDPVSRTWTELLAPSAEVTP